MKQSETNRTNESIIFFPYLFGTAGLAHQPCQCPLRGHVRVQPIPFPNQPSELLQRPDGFSSLIESHQRDLFKFLPPESSHFPTTRLEGCFDSEQDHSRHQDQNFDSSSVRSHLPRGHQGGFIQGIRARFSATPGDTSGPRFYRATAYVHLYAGGHPSSSEFLRRSPDQDLSGGVEPAAGQAQVPFRRYQ